MDDVSERWRTAMDGVGRKPTPAESPKLRAISGDELQQVLAAHQTWLESDGTQGEPADLSGAYLQGAELGGAKLQRANLQGADLQEADLDQAELQGADLEGANLQKSKLERADLEKADLIGADLRGANLGDAKLQGANLTGAKLQGAKLLGTNLRRAQIMQAEFEGEPNFAGADLWHADLRDADLNDAKLSDVTGLLADKLAGTDLSNARLPPDIAKFEALDHVAEISKHARNNFLAVLGACVFSWLTIATTTDAALLTNRAETALPVIGTDVPIAGFYWAAPPILLALFLYLHLYLQRMWTGLASLPAVFPDGHTLDRRAYPWLLTSLVNAHVPRLRERRPPFSRLMVFLSIVLAWLLVPATLGLFWLRYLPRHDWFWTIEQFLLFSICVAFAVAFYRRAGATLRGHEPPNFVWRQAWKRTATFAYGGLFLFVAAAGYVVSLGAIEGDVRRSEEYPIVVLPAVAAWVPYAFDRIGYKTHADLREADVSTKPATWTGLADQRAELDKSIEEKAWAELAQVKPAPLKDADLRYAYAYRAFLAKADLRGAKLQGADLTFANLQAADLTGAKLWRADLSWANLQRADLFLAEFLGAKLLHANLREAKLGQANFQKAFLADADLQAADLKNTILFRTNLRAANLTDAKNLTREQLDDACGDDETKLPDYLAGYKMKPCPELEQSPAD